MRPPIGSLTNARRVFEHERSVAPWEIPGNTDIKYVGAGANRVVYRIGTVVYKVDKTSESIYSNGGNFDEWNNYLFIQNEKLPAPYRLPRMHAFRLNDDQMVIAARYIPGERLNFEDESMDDLMTLLGLYDLSHENIVEYNGHRYLVDVGE